MIRVKDSFEEMPACRLSIYQVMRFLTSFYFDLPEIVFFIFLIMEFNEIVSVAE